MSEQIPLQFYPRPTRTSYSALTTFEACPLSYFEYYMNGRKDESGPAALRGTRLHTAAERFLRDEIPEERLPIDFWKIKKQLIDFKNLGAIAEEVWLVDKDWNHQDMEDEHTRLKALTDIHYLTEDTVHVVDLKTGRNYPEHEDQLQIYALLGFLKYPSFDRVTVGALYVDDGVMGHIHTYLRGMVPHLRDLWQNRMDTLFNATEFPATPSESACRYCKLRKSKGGPCPVI